VLTETEKMAVGQAAEELHERRVRRVMRRLGLRRHEAEDVVQAGTVKALGTSKMPDALTMAWFAAVDRSAHLDEGRKTARRRAGDAAMTALTVIHERATLPARSAGPDPLRDPNDDQDDHERHEAIHMPGDFDGDDRVRYLPFESPHVETATPLQALLEDEDDRPLRRLAAADQARADLADLARRAGVDDDDLALVRARYSGARLVEGDTMVEVTTTSWEDVAAGVGRKLRVKARVEDAVERLRAAARPGENLFVLLLRVRYIEEGK
jgi:DNA-directed RNA polymerase specialized sigma24 family protein